MKAILLFIIALGCQQAYAANCDVMTDVRNKFHAAQNDQALQSFLIFVKKINCTQVNPYKAGGIMKQAEYVYSPIKKLQYFRKGKAMLENHIAIYPQDIEARYVRILVQKNVPSILGYSSNISGDTKFIHSHIDDSELSSSYKKTILKYIKS